MSEHTALELRRILALGLIWIPVAAASAQQNPPAQKPVAELHAQNLPSRTTVTAKANIPFEFFIGPEEMPAGQYELQVIVPSVAIIRSIDGKRVQELFTLDIGPPVPENESRLVFVTRNGKRALTEIWCIEGKRRLTAEFTADQGDGAPTKTVDLSYE
jgi:hypothetical protein